MLTVEIKPVNCRCGRKVRVNHVNFPTSKYIRCMRTNKYGIFTCWRGPACTTPAAAVKAWNKVMGKKEEKS